MIPCPDCGGKGEVPNGNDAMACGMCVGSGRVPPKPDFGEALLSGLDEVVDVEPVTDAECDELVRFAEATAGDVRLDRLLALAYKSRLNYAELKELLDGKNPDDQYALIGCGKYLAIIKMALRIADRVSRWFPDSPEWEGDELERLELRIAWTERALTKRPATELDLEAAARRIISFSGHGYSSVGIERTLRAVIDEAEERGAARMRSLVLRHLMSDRTVGTNRDVCDAIDATLEAFRAEWRAEGEERGAKVPTVSGPQSEAGDRDEHCGVCGAVVTEPHLPQDCYVEGKAQGAIDTGIDLEQERQRVAEAVVPVVDMLRGWRDTARRKCHPVPVSEHQFAKMLAALEPLVGERG